MMAIKSQHRRGLMGHAFDRSRGDELGGNITQGKVNEGEDEVSVHMGEEPMMPRGRTSPRLMKVDNGESFSVVQQLKPSYPGIVRGSAEHAG